MLHLQYDDDIYSIFNDLYADNLKLLDYAEKLAAGFVKKNVTKEFISYYLREYEVGDIPTDRAKLEELANDMWYDELRMLDDYDTIFDKCKDKMPSTFSKPDLMHALDVFGVPYEKYGDADYIRREFTREAERIRTDDDEAYEQYTYFVDSVDSYIVEGTIEKLVGMH